MKSPKYKSKMGCSGCICRDCLMWWSNRCPYGGCFDDYRAAYEPYCMWHPEVRKQWTDWNKPGEQAHWCRGGEFYSCKKCEHYVKYTGHSTVRECLEQNVQVFQDGYILCGLVETWGCEECYRRFMEKEERDDT